MKLPGESLRQFMVQTFLITLHNVIELKHNNIIHQYSIKFTLLTLCYQDTDFMCYRILSERGFMNQDFLIHLIMLILPSLITCDEDEKQFLKRLEISLIRIKYSDS
ncbi:hypothetical protein RCL_jg16302.t1 [Rhizophagus clarus]|uniref:Uncharacterized protein n=1 Tax=Rhizophagus clarus TaxID=94130 RepID=A0A8H3M7S3_9GLOM|nr:hypothetical protein RCL_jg16302.t1 [Rhizophagus clarus]